MFSPWRSQGSRVMKGVVVLLGCVTSWREERTGSVWHHFETVDPCDATPPGDV
jgi:hypothetical protein